MKSQIFIVLILLSCSQIEKNSFEGTSNRIISSESDFTPLVQFKVNIEIRNAKKMDLDKTNEVVTELQIGRRGSWRKSNRYIKTKVKVKEGETKKTLQTSVYIPEHLLNDFKINLRVYESDPTLHGGSFGSLNPDDHIYTNETVLSEDFEGDGHWIVTNTDIGQISYNIVRKKIENSRDTNLVISDILKVLKSSGKRNYCEQLNYLKFLSSETERYEQEVLKIKRRHDLKLSDEYKEYGNVLFSRFVGHLIRNINDLREIDSILKDSYTPMNSKSFFGGFRDLKCSSTTHY